MKRLLTLMCIVGAMAGATANAGEPMRIDASAFGDLAGHIEDETRRLAGPSVDAHVLDPARIRVVIERLGTSDGELATSFDHAIAVWIDDEPFGAAATPAVHADCRACGSAELIDATVATIEQALSRRHARINPRPRPVAPQPRPAAAPVQPRDVAEMRPLGPLGKFGIVGLSLGAVAILGGGALAGIEQIRPLRDKSRVYDLRTAGYTTLALGSAALVTGAIMLAIDRRPVRPTAVSPALGPRHAGVSIHGRF
jgi:hypothetical protein